jgi:filamentous hemagglutinin family protein
MRQLHQRWGLGSLVLLSAIALIADCANAQVIPDQTLGTENSTVRNERIRGRDGIERDSDLIEGGARRGGNLFHSFGQFDVPEGRGAYFANPEGVADILGRVTGGDRSEIFGTLGVLGSANLFLINPNGIVFGSNASLDVQGSFAATTANGVQLGEQGFFSATSPEQSSLLEVNPGAFLFNQAVAQGGAIASTGNLTAGQDLTLSGLNLDLQGQLRAGRNLTLYGADTVRIRDSALNPFVAAAGGQMLVQGDRAVDIFALSHPNSGLFSGGDMVLRSGNTVGGDAHYWSGGNFRIERSDGSLGALYSPYDPVIRVAGDLTFDNYVGSSLHILAGGSVIVPGAIVILDADTPATSIAENITLSDGTIIPVDGSIRPTLDIRAGVDPTIVNIPGGFELIGSGNFLGDSNFSTTPTSAGIVLGNVIIQPPDGQVLITNQYRPNSSLTLPDILITGQGTTRLDVLPKQPGIDARGYGGNGSSVTLDSRGGILVSGSASINSSSELNRSGDIRLIAGEDILLGSSAHIESFSDNIGGNIELSAGRGITLDNFANIITGGGGEIDIQANQLSMERFSQISSPVNNIQDGGDINLRVPGAIRINGGNIGTVTLALPGTLQDLGDSGNITVNTGELEMTGASLFVGDSIPGGFLTGGDITSDVAGNANAGDITITADQVRLLSGAQIRASTSGTGNTGDVAIHALDLVEVNGIIPESDDVSKIAITVNEGAAGKGGDLLIATNRLVIRDEAQIQAGAFGAGQGGRVTINAPQSIEITSTTTDRDNATGILTGPEGSGASGNGGTLDITTGQLTLRGGGAQIANEVDSESAGSSGSTVINVDRLIATEGGRIRTGTLNTGQGGTLQITASGSIELSGVSGIGEDEEPSGLLIGTFGLADAGDLTLATPQLTIRGGAAITASTLGLGQGTRAGIGRGGDITINADAIEISGESTGGLSSSIVSEAGRFAGLSNSQSRAFGGNVRLTTDQLTVQDGAFISTQTVGAGNAGDLTINATGNIQLLDGDLRTRTTGAGNAGSLTLTAEQLTMRDGEAETTTDGGGGLGGNISVTVRGTTELIGNTGGLAASSFSSRDAGNLILQTDRLIVRGGAGISTESIGQIGQGRAGNLTIIAPNSVEVVGGAFRTGAEANATIADGNITGTSPFELTQTYFFPSRISAAVVSPLSDTPATNLSIQTNHLTVRNGGEISTQTLGNSLGGRLSIAAQQVDIVGNSANLRSDVERQPSTLSATTSDTGNAGNIQLNVRRLQVADNAEISAAASGRLDGSTVSRGAPGSILIQNADSIALATNGVISTEIASGVVIDNQPTQSGNINLQTDRLSLTNGAEITASTSGRGNAGNITIRDANAVNLDRSTISSTVNDGAIGNGGNINLQTDRLNLDRANITANTQGQGNAGNIIVRNAENIDLNDGSTISTAVQQGARGRGGNIDLTSDTLNLDNARITARTAAPGRAGNIAINASDSIAANNSTIETRSNNSSSGNVTIAARTVQLQGNSDIRTQVNRGEGSGGNIALTANSIVAFDDSDIVTRAPEGQGGNITFNTPAFFGDGYQPDTPETRNNNDRVDVDASGVQSGIVTTPDVSFIQNSLADLSDNATNPETLLANSCIVRDRQQGRFTITGSGGLPERPGNATQADYPTGTIQSVTESESRASRPWQMGDAIVEPQGVYRLSDGRLVMGRECEAQ